MLYKEKNYTIGINYLFNNYIREYDISKANISVLYSKGAISEYVYDTLYNSDRMTRQTYIGMAIKRNPELQDILSNGIIEYKQKLFESNNIQDFDIVSIKNDAVFIMNKIPSILSFDRVTFSHKNTYTSFMKLNELEVYYGKNVIDIKGIKDHDLQFFHMEFLNIIITYLEFMQRSAKQALDYITDIIRSYVNRELPIEAYRRFRSSSDYVFTTNNLAYTVNILDEKYKDMINIDHNFSILKLMHIYASQVLYEEKMK